MDDHIAKILNLLFGESYCCLGVKLIIDFIPVCRVFRFFFG